MSVKPYIEPTSDGPVAVPTKRQTVTLEVEVLDRLRDPADLNWGAILFSGLQGHDHIAAKHCMAKVVYAEPPVAGEPYSETTFQGKRQLGTTRQRLTLEVEVLARLHDPEIILWRTLLSGFLSDYIASNHCSVEMVGSGEVERSTS